MKDWLNIVGDKLKSIEEPLSPDDWNLLQQKYAKVKAKKRTAKLVWISSLATVAASILILLVLIKPESKSNRGGATIAEVITPADSTGQVPQTLNNATEDVIENMDDNIGKLLTVNDISVIGNDNKLAEVLIDGEVDKNFFEKQNVRGEVAVESENREDKGAAVRENSVDKFAVASENRKQNVEIEGEAKNEVAPNKNTSNYKSDYLDDDFYFRELSQERFRKSRAPISFALSSNGVLSGSDDFNNLFNSSNNIMPTLSDSRPSYSFGPPSDNKDIYLPMLSLGSNSMPYSEVFKHQLPISFGLLAKIHLNDRFSVNTGINYTLYTSTTYRSYLNGTNGAHKQNAHYLGIPLRVDYKIVKGEHISLYVGTGAQVDKCIYLKIANDTFNVDELLLAVNGIAGIQWEINDLLGLYVEPEISFKLNDGVVNTYRVENPLLISARAGLCIKL